MMKDLFSDTIDQGEIRYGTGNRMKPMESKAQSRSDRLPGDLDFYGYLSEFFVKNGKVEDISGLVEVVIEALPRILPISYVSIFLPGNSSKLILEGESEGLLKNLGPTEMPYDHLAAIQEWPSPLAELLGTVAHKSHLNNFKQILCFPIRVEDKVAGLICFKPKFKPLCEKTEIGLNLAIVQIGLTLERLGKGREIREEVFHQIDEMATLEKIILRSERQSCMAEMALGVADGIRNPLTVMGGLVTRISKKMSSESPFQKDWKILLEQMERLDRLIKDFGKFAHKREFILEKWDINQVIRQTAIIIKEDFLRVGKVHFDLHLQSLPCYIRMDRNLMGAALTHLLLNAAEATDKEGLVTITTYSRKDKIVVEIQDNGKGIPSEILARIFDPFFSTKHGGTGLGLTHVNQVISEHNGEILVDSRINKGTTFTIIFSKFDKS